MNTVTLICPNLQCRRALQVPADVRGRVVKCRFCGTEFFVPKPNEPSKPCRRPATPPVKK